MKSKVQAYSMSLIQYLAATAYVIRKSDGQFVSKTEAGKFATVRKTPTCDLALQVLRTEESTQVEEGDRELAECSFDWAFNISEHECLSNSYMRTIKEIALNGSGSELNPRLIGFAASIVSSYSRAKAKEEEADRDSEMGLGSNYVGNIGEKISFELDCERVIVLEGHWGTSYIYSFVHRDTGNIFVWKASRVQEELIAGGTYKIEGSIKEHKEYRGVKQTSLTRCKINPDISMGKKARTPRVKKAKVDNDDDYVVVID